MTVQYIYKVTDLIRDVKTGIVVTAMFCVTVQDGVDSYTVDMRCGFPPPDGNMIPYGDLTEADVISWIRSVMYQPEEKEKGGAPLPSEPLYDAMALNEFMAYKERKKTPQADGTPW